MGSKFGMALCGSEILHGFEILCVFEILACVRTHMHQLEVFSFVFYRLERKLRMLPKVIVNCWLATSVSLLYVCIFFSPLSKT